MTDGEYQKLLAAIGQLSQAQLVELDIAIRTRVAGALIAPPGAMPAEPAAIETQQIAVVCSSIATIEANFTASPECPHCQSTKIQKWGSANQLKRYR